jgi:ketosteroid isomerase-like protein
MTDRVDQPDPADPVTIFETFIRTGVEGDLDAQADLYAPDGVLTWPFAPEGVPTRIAGREAIREVLTALHAGARSAGTSVDIAGSNHRVHHTSDPEVIVVEVDLRTADGRSLPYIQVYRVHAGRIAELHDYWGPGTGAFVATALART